MNKAGILVMTIPLSVLTPAGVQDAAAPDYGSGRDSGSPAIREQVLRLQELGRGQAKPRGEGRVGSDRVPIAVTDGILDRFIAERGT
jgi:hypothetical protein